MNDRPDFELIYMEHASRLARRSTCQRVGSTGERYPVGCVIMSPDFAKMYGSGYNGNAHGLSNGCDDPSAVGGCGCLHAELNAALKCGRTEHEKVVLVTHSPCPMCAKALIQITNVTRLYYRTPYRIRTGIEMLRSRGVKIYRFVGEEAIEDTGDEFPASGPSPSIDRPTKSDSPRSKSGRYTAVSLPDSPPPPAPTSNEPDAPGEKINLLDRDSEPPSRASR